jgi:hypothetical protein
VNNNFSEVKYRYDIGANVWAKSPTIDGNATNSGKETVREFDNIGRPTKETLVNTGAYTRYEYPNYGVQSKVYSTITDVNNNGADSSDEVLSESWADGAGRVRRSRKLGRMLKHRTRKMSLVLEVQEPIRNNTTVIIELSVESGFIFFNRRFETLALRTTYQVQQKVLKFIDFPAFLVYKFRMLFPKIHFLEFNN